MNEASSRSHVVATIGITQHTRAMQSIGEGGQEQQQLAPPGAGVQVVTKAKLHLVDLAGGCCLRVCLGGEGVMVVGRRCRWSPRQSCI